MTQALPAVPAYRLIMPHTQRTPVVFASPHSGRYYPADFLKQAAIDSLRLRSSEDAFVDLLLEEAPTYGAPLLLAQYPRAYVDVNRAADELDPALIEGLPNRHARNARLIAGLGVIPRVVSAGRAIYSGKIPASEAESRIEAVWRPYHSALHMVLEQTKRRFGCVLLLDMHSMPSDALLSMGLTRPQIVLGDRFGRSAQRATTELLETLFAAEGLRVMRNTPFAGAYITETYGTPENNTEVIQIEIDRSLYMDEATLTPTEGFTRLKSQIRRIVARLTRASGYQPLAAE